MGSTACRRGRRELQAAEPEEDRGGEVGEAAEAASRPLHGLDDRVHPLHDAVGRPAGEPAEDSPALLPHGRRDPFHLRDVGVCVLST